MIVNSEVYKAKCTKSHEYLTVGKEYEIVKSILNDVTYIGVIKDDFGNPIYVNKNVFEPNMFVKFISDNHDECLNDTTEYLVIDETINNYKIENDFGEFEYYDKNLFEVVNFDDVLIPVTTINKIDNKMERVKMTLLEKIVKKLNVDSIAKKIYDEIEDEIIDKATDYIDEDAIATAILDDNSLREQYVETACDVLNEEALDANTDEILDAFKQVIKDKINY